MFEPIRLTADGRLVPVEYMTVHVIAGQPETGEWCDRCLLPAGLRIPLYIQGAEVGEIVACQECDDRSDVIARCRDEGRRIAARLIVRDGGYSTLDATGFIPFED